MGSVIEFRPKAKDENDVEFIYRVAPDVMTVVGLMQAASGKWEQLMDMLATPDGRVEDQDEGIKAGNSLLDLVQAMQDAMTDELREKLDAVERIAKQGVVGRAEANLLLEAFMAAWRRCSDVFFRATGRRLETEGEGC